MLSQPTTTTRQLATSKSSATSLRQLLEYYCYSLLLHAIPTTSISTRQLLDNYSLHAIIQIFVFLDINSDVLWTVFQSTDFQ